MLLIRLVDLIFNIIWIILIARILLSWVPNLDWGVQPFKFILAASEPLLAPFRGLIPPIGGIDLSPIILFLLLGVVQSIIYTVLAPGMPLIPMM